MVMSNPLYNNKDGATDGNNGVEPPASPGGASSTNSGRPDKPSRKACIIIGLVVLAVCGAVALAVGLGVGLTKLYGGGSSPAPAPPSVTVYGGTANLTKVVSKLLPYIPLDLQSANTQELLATYTEQVARIVPVSQLLARVAPLVGITSTSLDRYLPAVQPQAVQSYINRWLRDKKVDGSSLAATLDNLAQLAQGVPDWQVALVPVARSLGNVTALVNARVAQLLNSTSSLLATTGGSAGSAAAGAGGRRRLQQQASAITALKAAVADVLSSEAAAPYVAVLKQYYDPAALPDLAEKLYVIVRRLVDASPELREIMMRLDTHFDLGLFPSLPILDPRTGTNLSMAIDVIPYDKSTAAVLTASARRALQAADPLRAALLLPQSPLPAGFTPQPPAARPRVYLPLVFHITLYRLSDGTYGPYNYQTAAASVARLVNIANTMAATTGFQFFVNEVRADPAAQPYLVRASSTEWQDCAEDIWASGCDGVFSGALDHPRSVNIYVGGDSSTSFSGYAFVPSSPSMVDVGHVFLTWASVDAAQDNGQGSEEWGGTVLWHELLHHLGLSHTFGAANQAIGCDAVNDGIDDTPTVAGPVWSVMGGRGSWFYYNSLAYCDDQKAKRFGRNWTRIYDGWRGQLGIPPEDSNHAFDSCPDLPGVDELGNYITYTFSVCIPALGHQTRGQVQMIHSLMSSNNPRLYNWGQYFATLAPAGTFPDAASQAWPPSSPPKPPALPPPPSPPRPAPFPPDGGLCMRTQRGCTCKSAWSYRTSQIWKGCGNPDNDPAGLWCIVTPESAAFCNARQGWWDYCESAATEERCAAQFPRPPSPAPLPPAPPPRPPSPTPPSASACLDTVLGCRCRQYWYYNGGYSSGCANPDRDPDGAWCFVEPGCTATTLSWDYCPAVPPANCTSFQAPNPPTVRSPPPAPSPPSPPPPTPAPPSPILRGPPSPAPPSPAPSPPPSPRPPLPSPPPSPRPPSPRPPSPNPPSPFMSPPVKLPPPPSPEPSPPSPPPPSPPPPPPPVPPDPLTACTRTRGNCTCKPSWSWKGQTLRGCNNPDSDPVGLWCQVQQDGNCTTAINGYWDYCTAAATDVLCSQVLPRPPSPPLARPPPPLVPCGPGHTTVSGSQCSREAWAFTTPDGSYNSTHLGCANPDQDPKGSWCRLQSGFTSLLGRTWDYCGAPCGFNGTLDSSATAGAGADGGGQQAPPPPAAASGNGNGSDTGMAFSANTPCSASQGLPAGCECAEQWGAVLHLGATHGRRYKSARMCTTFPETSAVLYASAAAVAASGVDSSALTRGPESGVCVVRGCNDGTLNGRVLVCASPCTQMRPTDGETIEIAAPGTKTTAQKAA